MRILKRLATFLAIGGFLVSTATTLEARTRKSSRFYTQGYQAEQLKDYEKALGLYEQAAAADPADILYQVASRRVRFQVAQGHVGRAQKLRGEGKLEEALAEFQKAYVTDPSSPIAAQEMQRTLDMIDREKKRGAAAATPEERGLTPAAAARRELDQRLAAVMSVPELKPLSAAPINVKLNNQLPRVLFESVGKLAGVNVLFDPAYPAAATATVKPLNVEFTNATLQEALDYLAMITKSFWKPVTANAVFIAEDTPAKRTELEEQVAKIIYINNAGGGGAGAQNELTEIVNAVRTALGTVRSVLPIGSQRAMLIRGTADQVALAEMLIRNLDRPKAEVVVDVIVMEVGRTRSRTLGATPVSGTTDGLSLPISYTGGASGSQSASVVLNRIKKLGSGSFSINVPGAALDAIMSDGGTRVLRSPQIRALDGMIATLKIGDKVPVSSGGIQPIAGGTGVGGIGGGLYNSFNWLDVGVNVEITPTVHGADDVTLKVALDVSNVKQRIDIGGISQPVIGQNNIKHDIRLKDGEVSLLGGLTETLDTKTVTGVPGLASIPLIRRLFSSETIDRTESDLLIALVPHIIRTPDLDELNYKGIASGNQNTIHLTYSSPRAAAEPAAPAVPAATQPAVVTPAATQPAVMMPASGLLDKLIPTGPPASVARVAFSPAAAQTQPGGTVTLNLQVENATDVFAAPLRVRFDPNVLRVSEVTRGGFLAGDGRDVLFTRNILNDTGEVSVNLSRMPGSAGINGSGTLVTLTFQVIGKGITTVSAPQLTVQDSRAQTILTASPQVTITVR
jgi:general secretion pathway protein D